MFGFLNKLFNPKIDFKELISSGAIILDVRTPEEFHEGHIEGSLNIPIQVIQGNVANLKKKGKPIIAVCRSGARSGMAVGILKNAGIEAYNGYAWNSLLAKLN